MPSSGVQTCARSEEHTSELQSHSHLVCRLLLEKKKLQAAFACQLPHGAPAHTRSLRPAHQLRAYRPLHLPLFPWMPTVASLVVLVFFFNDPAPTEIYPLSLPAPLPINDTATTEIYTLSLHDALPISVVAVS